MNRSFRLALGAMVLICISSARLSAVPLFDRMWIFGDSLSDVGNLYLATGGLQPPASGYWQGRSSNGLVWVEYLAPKLELPVPTMSLTGGNDFAFRGAFSSGTGLGAPGLDGQVSMFAARGVTPGANDLFVVWAGANDFIFGSPNPTVVANNVLAQINALKTLGARKFLVMNLPPMGLVPDLQLQPQQVKDLANAASMLYNATLDAGLDGVRSPTVSVTEVDVFGLFQQIIASPASFGLTNVTDDFPGTLGDSAANGYLFWDTVHPTTAAHALVADAAYQALIVPEPASAGLMLLAGVSLLSRRRRAA